jgi:hypothetical protein
MWDEFLDDPDLLLSGEMSREDAWKLYNAGQISEKDLRAYLAAKAAEPKPQGCILIKIFIISIIIGFLLGMCVPMLAN